MKVINRRYFNPNDGYLRAMNLRYGRVVNLNRGISQSYWFYMNEVDINQRINNRSWLASNYDGAMKLSVRHSRRNMHKDRPYIEHSKYGQSKWNEFDLF